MSFKVLLFLGLCFILTHPLSASKTNPDKEFGEEIIKTSIKLLDTDSSEQKKKETEKLGQQIESYSTAMQKVAVHKLKQKSQTIAQDIEQTEQENLEKQQKMQQTWSALTQSVTNDMQSQMTGMEQEFTVKIQDLVKLGQTTILKIQQAKSEEELKNIYSEYNTRK